MAGEQYREWTNSAVVLNSYNNGIHDVILQGLEQSLRYGESEVYYPTDSFKDSIEKWNNLPLVYVPSGEHIPVDQFNNAPEAALKKYNAEMIGNITDPQIVEQGQRRLQGKAVITNPEFDEKIKSGDIQISTSFIAPGTDRIQSPVSPSYVLAFDKTKAQPRDKLTMFLNNESDKSHNHNTEEKTHMSETEAAVKVATLERDLSEKEQAVERANAKVKAKDETIERLNTELSEKDQKIQKLENSIKEFKNAEENRQWQNIKDNYIPPGMVSDETKENSMRELYNTNKDQFWMKVAKAIAERPPETHREGNEFSNTSGGSALEKEMNDLGISIDVEE